MTANLSRTKRRKIRKKLARLQQAKMEDVSLPLINGKVVMRSPVIPAMGDENLKGMPETSVRMSVTASEKALIDVASTVDELVNNGVVIGTTATPDSTLAIEDTAALPVDLANLPVILPVSFHNYNLRPRKNA